MKKFFFTYYFIINCLLGLSQCPYYMDTLSDCGLNGNNSFENGNFQHYTQDDGISITSLESLHGNNSILSNWGGVYGCVFTHYPGDYYLSFWVKRNYGPYYISCNGIPTFDISTTLTTNTWQQVIIPFTTDTNNIGFHLYSESAYTDLIIVSKYPSISFDTTVCDSMISPFGNYVWENSGIYFDTLQNQNGCDSFVTYNLNLLNTSYSSLTFTDCDSINFNGNTYLNSTTYFDSLQNSKGCDSLVEINLIVNSSSTITNLNVTECDNYSWNGNSITSSGTYFDTLTNNSGCDSILQLDLVINQSKTNNQTITSCDSIEFDGETYFQDQTKVDSFSTINGCDSIIFNQIIINSSTILNLDTTLILGDTFSFGNTLITQNGEYEQTFNSTENCDSIVIMSVSFIEDSIANGLGYWKNELISIYPIPFNDLLHINLDKGNYTIQIFDALGNEIKSLQSKNSGKISIDGSYMKSGLYFINIYDSTSKKILTSKKIIKE